MASPPANQCVRLAPPACLGNPDSLRSGRAVGADWLDRLELLMVIEDQFAGVEIADADVDQIEVVGDLIRYIETVGTR